MKLDLSLNIDVTDFFKEKIEQQTYEFCQKRIFTIANALFTFKPFTLLSTEDFNTCFTLTDSSVPPFLPSIAPPPQQRNLSTPDYLLKPSTPLSDLHTLAPSQLKEVILTLKAEHPPTINIGRLTLQASELDDCDSDCDFQPRICVPTHWFNPSLSENEVTDLIRTFAQSEFPKLAQLIATQTQQKLLSYQSTISCLQRKVTQLQTFSASLPTSLTFETFTSPDTDTSTNPQ